MVWEVAQAVDIPINGVGGVMTGEDAAEFILAGATCVSVGMANFVDPCASLKIAHELEASGGVPGREGHQRTGRCFRMLETDARDRVIVALDCDRERALELAHELSGHAARLKVGMTLYYAEGPQIVKTFKDSGFRIFLDLKFHDIPHQVRGAARSASLAGADLLSVHGLGSGAMLLPAARVPRRRARTAPSSSPSPCSRA